MKSFHFTEIPPLVTDTLTLVGTLDCGNENIQFAFDNAEDADMAAYEASLVDNGYERIAENRIGENRFATYKKDSLQVHLILFGKERALRVIKGRVGYLLPTSPVEAQKKGTPTLTSMPLAATGLLLVLQLCDKSFIIIDGGVNNADDRERLYAYLVSKTPMGEIPKITWFFTHAHTDHIRLATGFLEQYADKIALLALCHDFPDLSRLCLSREAPEQTMDHIEKLADVLERLYPETPICVYHTGQKFYFPECELEVIETFEDLYPQQYRWINDTSSAYRITLEGKSIIVFGDCTTEMNDLAVMRFGEHLRSDIMQVPHHGAGCASFELYKTVDPRICLWAVSKIKFEGDERMLGLNKSMTYNAWLRDNANGVREHYHQSEITEIDLTDMTVKAEDIY